MDARTFHILTFGCQMNVTDSQWLARALAARGFSEAPLETARVCIVNTCSVREKPEQKVYSSLGRIRTVSREPGAFSVVAGCVAQQLGQSLLDRFREVRLVVGGDALPNAPAAIERLCAEPDLRLNLTDFSASYRERDPALAGVTLPPVAFVNIMQGCDNFCAYCIVPYTRGRQKSRAPEAILGECRATLAHGAKEITLLGQNVNSYGLDGGAPCPPGQSRFAALLREVAALPGLERLRFVTPHPKDLPPEVISLFGELPQLCPRLHLPLQAGADTVLARMGRKYNSARYLELVRELRRVRPDMALSTDLIVGFPGETEEEFRQTLDVVKEAGFMSAFSFCYSDRPGTKSAMLPGKLDTEVKLERLSRLQAQVDEQAAAWLKSRVGLRTEVLLEGTSRRENNADPSAESWQGKDPWGDTVNLSLPAGAGRAGMLVPAVIVAAKRHSLNGMPSDGLMRQAG